MVWGCAWRGTLAQRELQRRNVVRATTTDQRVKGARERNKHAACGTESLSKREGEKMMMSSILLDSLTFALFGAKLMAVDSECRKECLTRILIMAELIFFGHLFLFPPSVFRQMMD
jgi:hypothetical protein